MAASPEQPRHSWLGRLEAAPKAEIAALIGRYAAIFPYERAEPSDAAAALLCGLTPDDSAVQAFENGCWLVLEELRGETASAERSTDRERIAALADDLMTVILRVQPQRLIKQLHSQFVKLNNWTENLVFSQSLNVKREYYRLLALTQDIANKSNTGVRARRMLPFWLDVCLGAGPLGPLDETYLRVGLLGLRRLPLADLVDGNEVAVVEGLVRWASAQQVDTTSFDREWRLIFGAYPRESLYWQQLLHARLRTLPRAPSPLVPSLPHFWIERALQSLKPSESALGTAPSASRRKRLTAPMLMAAVRPPNYSKFTDVLKKIRQQQFGEVKPQVISLLDEHKRFMARSGITDIFSKTTVRLGNSILKQGVGSLVERANFTSTLAQDVIEIEPGNAFGWSLWVSALSRSENPKKAAWVGWETVRRFPTDVVAANHLAAVLQKDLGLQDEAEALLRETLNGFDKSARGIGFARNQLASILAEKEGGAQEAEAILRETIGLFSEDKNIWPVSRNLLATLIAKNSDRFTEAGTILRETIAAAPEIIRPRNQLALLLSTRLKRPKEAVAVLEETVRLFSHTSPADDLPDLVVARNQLAVILAGPLNRSSDAKQYLLETINRYPNSMGASIILEGLQAPDFDADAFELIMDEEVARRYRDMQMENPLEPTATKNLLEVEPPEQGSPHNLAQTSPIPHAGPPPRNKAFDIGQLAAEQQLSALEAIRPTAHARRLMTLMHADSVTPSASENYRAEIGQLISREPTNPYLRLVANKAGVEVSQEGETVFALALQSACMKVAINELVSMTARFTNMRQLKLINHTHKILIQQQSSNSIEVRTKTNQQLFKIVNDAASELTTRIAA